MKEIFYLMKKIIFRSQDILIFVFLVNPETAKSVRSSFRLLHIRSHTLLIVSLESLVALK